ncbi:M23 family metallopeptidase [Taibaiella koreensis]|uniref:M23 family metallopeptidase n=1 Tax=Taibaiella koreensis TaxID=1268548 RepID=UPI0013C2D68C|nr:M23 family metallopeptidase [Taibaiella koreensis]
MKAYLPLFLLGLGLSLTVKAQQNYPQDYFRNPLDIPILLAGNFGECRPNHFHTGLDLKTNEKENLKVYAAADGYVSRISISWSGYGNALYITHPNGYTTLYGHLNDFYPELQRYLRQQQYERESWNGDLYLQPGQFPVKKGQLIAYSGTTGGSTGPHLHFEIRDTRTEHVLNAALFGLPIKDGKAPVPKSVALYSSGSIYEQQPVLYPLLKNGDDYMLPGITATDAQVRLGVLADDFMEGSPNPLGVYSMKLYLDDALQASWVLDDINFDENRYVNAFADYRLKEDKKGWYQTLFRIPGNHIANYTFLNDADGALDLSDGQPHALHIELRDAAGNTTHIRGHITGGKAKPAMTCKSWKAGQPYELKTNTLSFKAGADALYDDICFRYSEQASPKSYSSVVQLQETRIPLHSNTKLSVRLNRMLPFSLSGKLVFIHRIKAAALPGNNPQDAAAASFEQGWAKADVRTFGNYVVGIDTVAPLIVPLPKGTVLTRAKQIRFRVTDNMTSVQQFRAELDGRWLCFVRAGNVYTYTFDEHCPPGKHNLVITAGDENNNSRKYTFTFTR